MAEYEIESIAELRATAAEGDALAHLPEPAAGPPDPTAYCGYADALAGAYARRFETLGHAGDMAHAPADRLAGHPGLKDPLWRRGAPIRCWRS